MAKNKRISKGKEIRPTYFVFCEGETEEVYVKYLRSQFKAPVELFAKVEKPNINEKTI